jgi:hypothetical protein
MNKNYQSSGNLNNVKNNYEINSSESFPIFANYNLTDNKKEDFITFKKNLNSEVKTEFNRISNLKDNELTLEDRLQIQKQINEDDNDNDDQIEVISKILNNFEKDKFKNKKFMMYKSGIKNKYKSSSVINRNTNKILSQIKKDIALINFQQEINKINKLHNYKILIKSERPNLTLIKKSNFESINGIGIKNKERIEKIKKRLNSKSKESKSSNKKNNDIKNLFKAFNMNRKKENFLNSRNETAFNYILDEINNFKEMKTSNLNNNNINNDNNNLCNTFRRRINYDSLDKKINEENPNFIFPVNKQKLISDNADYLKTEETTNISLYNSKQFFFSVYRNAIKKYPYLHLLKNKINKMKRNDMSKIRNNFNDINKIEDNFSLLEKINSQKNLFQKEIESHIIKQ